MMSYPVTIEKCIQYTIVATKEAKLSLSVFTKTHLFSFYIFHIPHFWCVLLVYIKQYTVATRLCYNKMKDEDLNVVGK